jgi:hypothetical protein
MLPRRSGGVETMVAWFGVQGACFLRWARGEVLVATACRLDLRGRKVYVWLVWHRRGCYKLVRYRLCGGKAWILSSICMTWSVLEAYGLCVFCDFVLLQ